jgi:malonate-semialdehyde dehydrogenase (acetylating)/methylmalonate-semialdehyde dehydrogenase
MLTHWIGGESVSGDGGRTTDVFDPATGDVRFQLPLADTELVDRAVTTAAEAWKTWRDVSLARRARIMFRFRELVEQRTDDIARLITEEHGKVLSDSQAEVARGLEVVDFACGIPHLAKSEYSENVSTGIDSYSIRQALGVVAGITPFNFPAMVPMWMFPIAIACGNTFVLKPSERDPSASMLLAELLQEAGLPDGVFNVVHGDKDAVNALLTHPKIAAISSVSSTPVAQHIYETASKHGKRVQALGGAKNHAVVLPDADLDIAADAITGAAFGSTGQRCMALSAVLAVGDSGDALREKLAQRAEAIKVGAGDDAAAEMGPLVTAQARDKCLTYVEQGVSDGADLVVDGRGVSVDGHEGGYYLGPCLFDKAKSDMSIYTDEIFGPVLTMVRVGTYDEAVELVNTCEFGNGVALFTSDGGAARAFQRDVEVGMVGINVPIPVPMAYYSFGGWKASLFGDTHIHGTEGIRFYTKGKVVTQRWIDPHNHQRGVNLGFPQNK